MSDLPMEDWAGEVGDRWLAHIDRFESMLEPIGKALVATARFQPGERVADVGCGGGLTTFAIARDVAPHGFVTGFDISAKLVDLANRRRRNGGELNCAFHCVDAEVSPSYSSQPLDRLFSRFGVMFFAHSQAAFRNMRSWLRPGGEMIFACWASPQDNPWIGLVGQTIGRFVDMPQRDPDGPGPFRFADPEATAAMLRLAGFTEISFSPFQAEQALGGAGANPAEAADFVLDAMGMRDVLAAAGPDVAVAARSALIDALIPYQRDAGIMMQGTCWFVRARNPG